MTAVVAPEDRPRTRCRAPGVIARPALSASVLGVVPLTTLLGRGVWWPSRMSHVGVTVEQRQ